jgi:hypothetical protein
MVMLCSALNSFMYLLISLLNETKRNETKRNETLQTTFYLRVKNIGYMHSDL